MNAKGELARAGFSSFDAIALLIFIHQDLQTTVDAE